MRDLFFRELRECIAEIHTIEEMASPDEILKDRRLLLDSFNGVLTLANEAKRQGLLWLEEYVPKNYPEKTNVDLMVNYLTKLVLGGPEPELVEEIALIRYFSMISEAYESLAMLMYIYGFVGIYNCEKEGIIEERMLAMLPPDMFD